MTSQWVLPGIRAGAPTEEIGRVTLRPRDVLVDIVRTCLRSNMSGFGHHGVLLAA